jgi:hypothetical protein
MTLDRTTGFTFGSPCLLNKLLRRMKITNVES